MPQPVSADFDRTPSVLGSTPVRIVTDAVGRTGVDGVHEQVDDDLVNPAARQRIKGSGAQFHHDRDACVAGVALDHVHRRLDARV